MQKRIVIEQLNGLRKIIGHMEVAPGSKFTSRYDSGDMGVVEFVKENARHIIYKEILNES